MDSQGSCTLHVTDSLIYKSSIRRENEWNMSDMPRGSFPNSSGMSTQCMFDVQVEDAPEKVKYVSCVSELHER